MLPSIGFLSTYVLCITVGFIIAFILNRYLALRSGQSRKDCWISEALILVSLILGWFFAAVMQGVYSWIANPNNGFSLFRGLTFYGGLFGGCICYVCLYRIIKKSWDESFFRFLTYIPVSICLVHAFGRLGCFCAGCCYGKPTDSVLGVQFPRLPEKVWPTQLFESGFLLILSLFLFILLIKKNNRFNISWYCIGYGVWRFFIEFLRGDPRGSFVPGLSPSQFWSIVLVCVGFLFLFILSRHYRRTKNIETNFPFGKPSENLNAQNLE